MAALNPLTREVVFKLVFYGPGLGGKTTTLEYIHAATKPEHRGKMVSLATPTDRTLYFDYLPIRVPRVRGMSVRLQLFTVPGQVHFGATRKLVLSGADAVIFVADSQAGRAEANREALEDLVHNLAEHNRHLEDVPHTFHWNKRDLSDLMSVEELERRFNPYGAPSLETVATRGEGVFEGLERATRLALRAYEAEMVARSPEVVPGLSEDDLGIADAIRSLTESPRQTTPPSAEASQAQANHVAGHESPMTAPPPTRKHSVRATSVPPPPSLADLPPIEALRSVKGDSYRPPSVIPAVPPVRVPSSPPVSPSYQPAVPIRAPGAFTAAELWPESERENVRNAEALLAAGDAGNAVLACELLVTRVLAGAAAIVGTGDAPRDPSLVAMLMGVEGARYLAFRARVKNARQKLPVTMKDAWECYALALDARLARERIAG